MLMEAHHVLAPCSGYLKTSSLLVEMVSLKQLARVPRALLDTTMPLRSEMAVGSVRSTAATLSLFLIVPMVHTVAGFGISMDDCILALVDLVVSKALRNCAIVLAPAQGKTMPDLPVLLLKYI